MPFPLNIYLLSCAGAACVSFCLMPLLRRVSLRLGLVDDPGHRKVHQGTIPLAGGIAVLAALLVPWLVFVVAWRSGLLDAETQGRIQYGIEKRFWRLGAVLVGAVGMVALGGIDDRWELRPGWKFLGQLLVAGMVTAAGVRITLFIPNLAFSYAVTLLWIVTLINAFNFMDNMNGLCAGLGVVSSSLFALNAAWAGQYLVAALAFLCAGALLGFLPYNFPRASAFLGDAGSHLVGYMMAVLAILPHFYSARSPHRLAVLSPLLIVAVPLGDAVWVVLLRWRDRKPFYVGDTNHLSHRLVRLGLSPARAVVVIWGVSIIIGLGSFLFRLLP